jgi:hypothetical protein
MKNRIFIYFTIFMTLCYTFSVKGKTKKDKELQINHVELGYPCPAIPFYHFIAELELPEASIIEVEAAINNKVLRFVDLHREDEITEWTNLCLATGHHQVMACPRMAPSTTTLTW